MRRIAWSTDPHLNFVARDPSAYQAFLDQLSDSGAEALLLTGDLAEAPSLSRWLLQLRRDAAMPLYFVLGNHDFYKGSIHEVHERLRKLLPLVPDLCWLPEQGPVSMSAEADLLGVDGWGDARLGDAQGSRVVLNDFLLIRELNRARLQGRLLEALQKLGDDQARLLRRSLAAAQARKLLILTHVPPFRAACWHEGRPSGDDWLPFFTCHAVGQALLDHMRAHPEQQAVVLCGHTHSGGQTQPLPNLRVLTGPAEYGRPRIHGVFQLDEPNFMDCFEPPD